MILSQFDNTTDTRDIDYTRSESLAICRSLRQKTEERSCDEEDRECVDGVKTSPFLKRFVLE